MLKILRQSGVCQGLARILIVVMVGGCASSLSKNDAGGQQAGLGGEPEAFWGDTPEAGRSPASSTESKFGAFTTALQYGILKVLTKYRGLYLSGQLSHSELLSRIERIRGDYVPAGASDKREAFELIDKKAIVELRNAFRQHMALKKLSGVAPSAMDNTWFKHFQSSDSVDAAVIADDANRLRPAYEALKEHFSYDAEHDEWDFSSWKTTTVEDIKNSPKTMTALALLVSPAVPAALANPKRVVALPVGNTVFLPPVQTAAGKGKIRTMSLKRWNTDIVATKQAILYSAQNYLQQRTAGNSPGQLFFKGGLALFGQNYESDEDKYASAADVSTGQLLTRLKKLGAPLAMLIDIEKSLSEINDAEADALSHLEETLSRHYLALAVSGGLIVGRIIYAGVELVAAGVAASQASAEVATIGAATSVAEAAAAQAAAQAGVAVARSGLMSAMGWGLSPLAFSVGEVSILAAIDQHNGRRGFVSSFLSAAPDAFLGSVEMSGPMTFIPMVSLGMAARFGEKAKMVFDVGTAGVFAGMMAMDGLPNAGDCFNGFKKYNSLSADTRNNVDKACAKAMLDLSLFAVTAHQLKMTSATQHAGVHLDEAGQIRVAQSILGLGDEFTPSDLKAAYRANAKVFHPDRNPSPDAHIRMSQINWAKEVLDGVVDHHNQVMAQQAAAAAAAGAHESSGTGLVRADSGVASGHLSAASGAGVGGSTEGQRGADARPDSSSSSTTVDPARTAKVTEEVASDPALNEKQHQAFREIASNPEVKADIQRAEEVLGDAEAEKVVVKAVQGCVE